MAAQSHMTTAAPVVTPSPPYERRQCVAIIRVLPPATKHAHDYREAITRRCLNTASPWLPEADYCATHVPSASLPIIEARVSLWLALLTDVWREVLATYPYEGGEQ